jgi:hydroxymethylglutaryl-CoA lyase
VLTLSECWARDGIQPEAFVPTAAKLAVLAASAVAGFRRIELTSFAHPRAWPQFADAEEVVRTYDRVPGVEYAVLAPNDVALDRALAHPRFDRVTVVVAASDSYNRTNVRRSRDDSLAEAVAMTARARAAGLAVTGCVGTAWACPIEGPTPPATVLDLASRLAAAGADEVMLGDTTGEAFPAVAGSLVAAVRAATGLPIEAHFHDSRGVALANAFAAVAAGAATVDCALGGVGGHPPEAGVQRGSAGNLCTEDVATAFALAGLETGLDLDALLAAGARAEQALGRPLHSRVQQAGLPVALRR